MSANVLAETTLERAAFIVCVERGRGADVMAVRPRWTRRSCTYVTTSLCVGVQSDGGLVWGVGTVTSEATILCCLGT